MHACADARRPRACGGGRSRSPPQSSPSFLFGACARYDCPTTCTNYVPCRCGICFMGLDVEIVRLHAKNRKIITNHGDAVESLRLEPSGLEPAGLEQLRHPVCLAAGRSSGADFAIRDPTIPKIAKIAVRRFQCGHRGRGAKERLHPLLPRMPAASPLLWQAVHLPLLPRHGHG